ncbi:MAG: Hpt domain-containing protein [Pseudobacteriovorax sp.]|nr:Hpt domain-containing protein [Pseudobacteriovorax sp.]
MIKYKALTIPLIIIFSTIINAVFLNTPFEQVDKIRSQVFSNYYSNSPKTRIPTKIARVENCQYSIIANTITLSNLNWQNFKPKNKSSARLYADCSIFELDLRQTDLKHNTIVMNALPIPSVILTRSKTNDTNFEIINKYNFYSKSQRFGRANSFFKAQLGLERPDKVFVLIESPLHSFGEFQLWTESEAETLNIQSKIIFYICGCLILTLTMVSFFMFFTTRNRQILSFIALTLAQAVSVTVVSGNAGLLHYVDNFSYFSPYLHLLTYLPLVTISFSSLLILQFSVGLGWVSKKILKGILIAGLTAFAFVAVNCILVDSEYNKLVIGGFYPKISRSLIALSLLTMLTIIAKSFIMTRDAIALIVFLSFLSNLFASVVFLKNIDSSYLNPFVKNSSLIGLSIQCFLLSIAIAISMYRHEKKLKKNVSELNRELHKSNKNLKDLNEKLEEKVVERTRDIQSIMTHVPIGIVIIGSNNAILERACSAEAIKIFKKEEVEEISFIEIIHRNFKLDSQELSRIATVVGHSIGGDSINFEANRYHLPLELESVDSRYFKITWSAVEDDDFTVKKIIVTIDDTTELKHHQQLAIEMSEEMVLVNELLSSDQMGAVSFLNSTMEFIEQNEEVIDSRKSENLKTIFHNLHTAKGSASGLGLERLSKTIHEVEDYLNHFNKNGQVDFTKLRTEHSRFKNLLQEYISLYKNKIGKSLVPEVRVSTILADRIHCAVKKSKNYRDLIFEVLAVSMTKFGESLLSDRHRIAGALGKPTPDIKIDASGYISHEMASFISGIFAHLLRNAIDHGIEKAEERIQKGKPQIANLTLKLSENNGNVDIYFSDDGRGLNLALLKEIGTSKNLISDDEDRSEIANLIFHEGFSTANRVTDISGRGVGMGAVKSFVETRGGSLNLILSEICSDYVPFKIHISIPDIFSSSITNNSKEVA